MPIAPSIVPSALTSYISSTCGPASKLTHPPHFHHLAAQVFHNLQYQHEWHALSLHTHSSSSPTSLLPRPLISGVPPHRVYTHPDMQIELIKKGVKEVEWPEERVWVLPSHIREKWSLKRFADVFDGLPEVVDVGKETGAWEELREKRRVDCSRWKEVQRVLLAVVEEDSTIVYYVVHNGIVKPRQN